MFKSKKTMQQHKRKQSQISRPTSTFQATARPSFPTHMQTAAGQAVDNNNHPTSAFQSTARPSFPTHMQTAAGQASVRPSFIYNMRQNSSSSSSSLQASVRPLNVHHNSSSSSSSSHSQSLQSQPTVHEPVLHQSSSTNSLLNDDQDLRDEYELNLLSEVEIIDGDGNILRIQKMCVKEVYKLNEGEKVLVHVNANLVDYIQEATTEMMVQANREILRKKLELGGPEGNVEHDVVAEIARNVLNTLIGDENPHCFGAGVTKSQVSKFSRDLRKMRGEVLTNENRFLLEKVQTQKKQLETQKKQLENQNKEIETHKKQLENQGLQLKEMGQKLNDLYGMLKVVETAFPDLYNGASTSAATRTCDKQPSFDASPITDHYSPVMDHYPGGC